MSSAMLKTGVLIQMERRLSELPSRQAAVARFVLKNPQDAKSISLQALCGECRTSEPVVFAFCKRLGYDSFRSFKTALAEDLGAQRFRATTNANLEIVDAEYHRRMKPEALFALMADSYRRSIEDTCGNISGSAFEKAVEYLDKAKRIAIIGVGVSGNVGFVALQNFIRTGTPVTWTNDPNLNFTHLAPLKSGDVCLALSQSGNQVDTIQGVAFAKQRGLKVIAVTSDHDSELKEHSDVVLLTGSAPTAATTHLSIGAEIALPILIVTDALAVALGARRSKDVQDRSAITYEAMKPRTVPPRRRVSNGKNGAQA